MPLREHYPIINETARRILLACFSQRPPPKPANDNDGPPPSAEQPEAR